MTVMLFCKLGQMKIVSAILAIQLSEPKPLYLESTNSSICYLLPYSHGFLAMIMSFNIEIHLNIEGVVMSKRRCHSDYLKPCAFDFSLKALAVSINSTC